MKHTSSICITGTRPASARSRPGTASKHHNYHHVGRDSYVDETLFANPNKLQEKEFDPPWAEKAGPRPLLFYTPTHDIHTPRSGRPGSTQGITPRTHRHIVTHKPSFIDETLFGPVPKDADFPAPWEKGTKSRPLLWCPPSYNNVNAEGTSARPSSKTQGVNRLSARGEGGGHVAARSKQQLCHQTKKPAWR